MTNKVKYLDSHTGGEPTRVILEGGPDLGSGPLSERAETLRLHFDEFRRSVIEEPRGWDALVGALCEPHDPSCEAGVLFSTMSDILECADMERSDWRSP